MDNFNNEQNAINNEENKACESTAYENGGVNFTMPESDPQPYQSVVIETKPKKKRTWLKFMAAVCAFAIITGAALGTTNYIIDSRNADNSSEDNSVSQNSSVSDKEENNGNGTAQVNTELSFVELTHSNGVDVSGRENEITQVVKNTMPSMVSINVIATQTVDNNYGYFFGYGGSYEYDVQGSGSGIIIGENEEELLIVTNNHVVEGAKEIAIEFIDGESYAATIKGTDAEWDLAVVAVKRSEITDSTMSQIKIAVMGDSDSLMLGECAIAIGNSLGFGQSVTVGYISATSRDVQFSDGTRTLIQTDAAINPGNSGGALLNINGEVIGINSAKYSSTEVEGMGYAIPITDASPIINDLMNSIVVPEEEKAFLGISGQDVPESYQSRFGWPAGVYISSVTEDSPASLAGIRAGDIITKVNGKEITTSDELSEIISESKVGDTIELEIARSSGNSKFTTYNTTAILISRGDIS